jgi:hypothetical protein
MTTIRESENKMFMGCRVRSIIGRFENTSRVKSNEECFAALRPPRVDGYVLNFRGSFQNIQRKLFVLLL